MQGKQVRQSEDAILLFCCDSEHTNENEKDNFL